MEPVLKQDGNGGSDYVLIKGERSAWIEVDNVVLRIVRETPGVVSVSSFRKGEESKEPLNIQLFMA